MQGIINSAGVTSIDGRVGNITLLGDTPAKSLAMTASAGTSNEVARVDHVHAFSDKLVSGRTGNSRLEIFATQLGNKTDERIEIQLSGYTNDSGDPNYGSYKNLSLWKDGRFRLYDSSNNASYKVYTSFEKPTPTEISAVAFTEQTLTDEQKAQARENIGTYNEIVVKNADGSSGRLNIRLEPASGAIEEYIELACFGYNRPDDQHKNNSLILYEGGKVKLYFGKDKHFYDFYTSLNPPPYPVTSVNGKTGDVRIDTWVKAPGWLPSAGYDPLNETAGFFSYSVHAGHTTAQPIPTNLSEYAAVIGCNSMGGYPVMKYIDVFGREAVWAENTKKWVLQYNEENPPPYPVTSVNGQTGAITVQKIYANMSIAPWSDTDPYYGLKMYGTDDKVKTALYTARNVKQFNVRWYDDNQEVIADDLVFTSRNLPPAIKADNITFTALGPESHPMLVFANSSGNVGGIRYTMDGASGGIYHLQTMSPDFSIGAKIYTEAFPPPYPVRSVDGQIGDVHTAYCVNATSTTLSKDGSGVVNLVKSVLNARLLFIQSSTFSQSVMILAGPFADGNQYSVIRSSGYGSSSSTLFANIRFYFANNGTQLFYKDGYGISGTPGTTNINNAVLSDITVKNIYAIF